MAKTYPLVLFGLLQTLVLYITPIHSYREYKNCKNNAGRVIQCPPFETGPFGYGLEKEIEECKNHRKAVANDHGFSCHFFPTEILPNGTEQSCHETSKNCTHGFILQATRQRRRSGGLSFVYINIKFFGLIQPPPNMYSVESLALKTEMDSSATPNSNPSTATLSTEERNARDMRLRDQRQLEVRGGFDVTEWIAIGLSQDKIMGDDMVLYCHPFMDKRYHEGGELRSSVRFPVHDDHKFYPHGIGISVNKYLTFTEGKQSFDAERIFGAGRGNIHQYEVRYEKGQRDDSWGYLECKAEVSTFILIQSHSQLSTGIELDMEITTEAHILMATGPCLHRDCYGDVEQNPVRDVAKRTTVMAKHRGAFYTQGKVVLFDVAKRDNSGGRFLPMKTLVLLILLF